MKKKNNIKIKNNNIEMKKKHHCRRESENIQYNKLNNI